MLHHVKATALDEILVLLAELGSEGMALAVAVLLNEVMKLERTHARGTAPYQQSEQRSGSPSGFEPKTLRTRRRALAYEATQTWGVEFHPSDLEKGARSE